MAVKLIGSALKGLAKITRKLGKKKKPKKTGKPDVKSKKNSGKKKSKTSASKQIFFSTSQKRRFSTSQGFYLVSYTLALDHIKSLSRAF